MTRQLWIHSLAFLLSANGCQLGEMEPGADCLECHSGGIWKEFGAAGTVYAEPGDAGGGLPGATVEITDADGTSVSMVTNRVGNFYTTEAITPPLRVTVLRAGAPTVSMLAPSGDCNGCHSEGSAQGRISVPRP